MKKMFKCFMATVMLLAAAGAGAQDLKSMLGGVLKNVVGDKTTTAESIIGTWQYVGPECQFDSDNALTKAGSEVAAQEVEQKMQSVFDKIGMDGCEYTFNEDGTYSSTIKGKTTKGTYTYDDENKAITMKGALGIKTTAYVSVMGSSMSLVFNADKLMTVLKAVTGAASKVNSTASAVNSIANSYDGLRLGFELKKATEQQAQ